MSTFKKPRCNKGFAVLDKFKSYTPAYSIQIMCCRPMRHIGPCEWELPHRGMQGEIIKTRVQEMI